MKHFLHETALLLLLTCPLLAISAAAPAAVTPERQQLIRAATFEVVLKKPEHDTVSYEKPLPLELLPYVERTDAYRSIGTAFALGHNTYVTAGHVILVGINSQYGAPALRSSDGKVYAIDHILKFSAHEDFVVFSLAGDPAPPGFESSRTPKIDDPVHAVGNALGDGVVVRDGLFTSETPEEQDNRWKWIRFSAAASPGNSGGPLLDQDGKVIGVVIGKSPNENLNYALPIGRVLDAPESKASFDQRVLTTLPFLQGGKTYTIKDEFHLPLSWPEFSRAYQDVSARHHDQARAEFLQAHADTMFPRGRGTESLLFDTNVNQLNPWLVTQQPDDSWSGSAPAYSSVDLAGDGSVGVASSADVGLLHLVRPNHAADDAFYQDSRAFMDLALRALNIRRSVGADQVKVTSLGPAVSDTEYVDHYGRRWQVRVWALPYADEYILGLLLPTPDGYGAILENVSSGGLREMKQQALLIADQFELSYQGTLRQWQAFLARQSTLPTALKGVHLAGAPLWSLRSRRFQIQVPTRLFAIDQDSLLVLTMGFMNDTPGVVWDIGDVWWYRDTHKETALGLLRRPKPPESARLELRNAWSDMQRRRTPFDGSIDRVGPKSYALFKVLDVPGKTAGAISSVLQYCVTVLVDRDAAIQYPDDLSSSIIDAVRLYERGVGEDAKPALSAATNEPSDDAAISIESKQVLQWFAEHGFPDEKDIRGRLLSEDVHDYLEILKSDAGKAAKTAAKSSDPALPVAAEVRRRSLSLLAYWSLAWSVTHNRDLWGPFLQHNHLPADTPHNKGVVAAESLLATTLAQPLGSEWSKSAATLVNTYSDERNAMVKQMSGVQPAAFRARVSPCPQAATHGSGGKVAGMGEVHSPLTEYYPTDLRKYQVQGTVVLGLRIDATGCMTEAGVVGSSGSEALDDSALRWVETASFFPAERDGTVVASEKQLAVNFHMVD